MKIKDLLNCVPGTEVVGFPLCIKTARKTFKDGDGLQWQEVVFIDSSGEMEGLIYLPLLDEEPVFGEKRVEQGHVWKSKDTICVMKGEIQESDTRKKQSNKLVVLDCFNGAPALSFDQQQSWISSEAEEWAEARKEEVRGKIRTLLVEGYLTTLPDGEPLTGPQPDEKTALNLWVEYCMTGQ